MKKIAIAACLVALYSGQFIAFASYSDNKSGDAESLLKKPAIVVSSAQTAFGLVDIHNKIQIFTFAAMDVNTDPGKLRLVCMEWKKIIDGLIDREDKTRSYTKQHPIWQKIMRVSYAGLGHDAEWERILNGELIYIPDESIKLGKVSDLFNPFADAFDISKCGDVSKKVHLRMGLRKGKRNEGTGMDEVHFTPRLMAVHKLEEHASYLKEIIDPWPEGNLIAPIFTWCDWDNTKFVYCVWANFEILSKKNLVDIYEDRRTLAVGPVCSNAAEWMCVQPWCPDCYLGGSRDFKIRF